MSDFLAMEHALRAVDGPTRVRHYPPHPAAADPDPDVERFRRQTERDNELRERLRHELDDKSRDYDRHSNYDAETGIAKTGEI